MTTPTHSHKAWTDKGGHVSVVLPAPVFRLHVVAYNLIRITNLLKAQGQQEVMA